MRKLLLLGGTLEARQIATALADDQTKFEATMSLAGVTSAPSDPGIPVRIGGFGGVKGLTAYLNDNRVDVLIDATHPFANRISENAVEACWKAQVERHALWRPAWHSEVGDKWIECNDWLDLLDELPPNARVFMAAGQEGIKAISEDTQFTSGRITCVARAIEEPQKAPPEIKFIKSRPAETWEEEAELFRNEGVTHLIVKNSGGDVGRAKLVAARKLGLSVFLLGRPAPPKGPLYETTEDILDTLNRS